MPKLNFMFKGMTLFVADHGSGSSKGCIHALFPKTHGSMMHHFKVRFRHGGVEKVVPLGADFLIDLSGLGSTGSEVKLGTVDLDIVLQAHQKVSGKVQKAQTHHGGVHDVAGRVTLPPANMIRPVLDDVGEWEVPGYAELLKLTNVVKVSYDESALTPALWKWCRLNGTGESALELPDADPVVEVWFDHRPKTDPDEPNLGQPAPHFHMLYPLVEDGSRHGPSPILRVKPERFDASSPYTCVVAEAPLQP